jgi:predicted PurR-regulated permease PerM
MMIIALALLLYFSIPSLVEQISIFIGNVPSLLNTVSNFINKLGLNLNESKFVNSINDIFIDASKSIMRYLSSSFSVLFDIALGLSGAIFLSFDFPKFRNAVKEYIPKRVKAPVIFYFQKFLPFVHKYFRGMLIDSVLIFIISIIGFSIIGVDYTLVISLIIAITNLIPIIGPYIGGIPAAIIGFSASATSGISAIVVVVIVQLVESNIMQPLILKNVIKLHPLEGILGISFFGTLFGVAGMILSPILVVAVKLLFIPYNENENTYLTERESLS